MSNSDSGAVGHKFIAAAEQLREARMRRQACAPIKDRFGIAGATDAYVVQNVNTQYWVENGRKIVGRKIGLTSNAVQAQMGVSQPDFGTLFADMEYSSGAEIGPDLLIQPRAEAEIAFQLGQDILDPAIPLGLFIRALDAAYASIEIVDSAIADWQIAFEDTVADNASSGVYVLSTDPISPRQTDLRLAGMVMERNGELVSLGAGAACLGHPAMAAHWLAKTMAAFGEPLHAGDIILSGALGPMVSMAPGDMISVEIGGVGSVRARLGKAQR
jgi:2-keto-4-pentenoate hydratase